MHVRAELKDILGRTFAEVAGTDEELPAPLLGLKFPAILVVENEFRLTPVKAELDFVATGAPHHRRRGPSSLWRDRQAGCERAYLRENDAAPEETASTAGSQMEIG
jgi:hypothetical protein